MELDTSTMNQFVSNVFDEMFGLPTEHLASAQFDVNQPRIVACIRISGVVEELIVVEAPVATACLISETMFDADPGTLEAEEIRDAIGEVVNIIGGNVKGMYEGESQLSLPCVSEETGTTETESDGGVNMVFDVAGQPMLVRWQNMSPAAV
ncbi:MAG TPA: chemotaxis protein CheX [Fuerstia sp.]|nr:chemotaxis protein CheX [Fuerstiella sp.]